MEDIRDCKGRIACKGNTTTGMVTAIYKGCRTSTLLSIGEIFEIERDSILTIVTRTNANAFSVESYPCAG